METVATNTVSRDHVATVTSMEVEVDLLTQAGGVSDKLRSHDKAPPLTESGLEFEDAESLSKSQREGAAALSPAMFVEEETGKGMRTRCLHLPLSRVARSVL